MGFRSTVISNSTFNWSTSFREKYKDSLVFSHSFDCIIASKQSGKMYGSLENLPEDIQSELRKGKYKYYPFVLVALHDCNGIHRCEIHNKEILWSHPVEWDFSDGDEHGDHCDRCSDCSKIENKPLSRDEILRIPLPPIN